MKNLRHRLHDQRGFNLIELMIVIAIIGLLIAVGGYGWQAMMRSGNENAAAQTMNKIMIFQAQYAGGHKGKFGTFDELINSVGMDDSFKGDAPVVNGYKFTLLVEEKSASKPAKYTLNADPQVADGVSSTGNVSYYTDSTIGTIRRTDEKRPAKIDDPAL